jgi:hypothetical protein
MVRIQKLKAVANGSFQLEVSDNEVVKPGQRPNLLSMLNADDSRFANNSRLAWIKTTPKQANEYFGIPLDVFDGLQEGEEVELNIENPKINGERLRVEVKERTEPMDDWQSANTKRAAKSIEIKGTTLKAKGLNLSLNITEDSVGQRGYFMTDAGQLIYSKTEVIIGEPKHEFIDEETKVVLASDIFEEEAVGSKQTSKPVSLAGSKTTEKVNA